MKFKDIKVGDIILVKDRVQSGGWSYRHFWVKKEVTRVTPKQFTAGKKRYNKETGSVIGDNYSACAEVVGNVKDQTEERNDFVRRLNFLSRAKGSLSTVQDILDKAYEDVDMENVQRLINELERAVDKP